MKARLDILYHETWHDLDPECNYIRVELRRYECDLFGRCDFVTDYVVMVDGETVIDGADVTVAHKSSVFPLRVAIAKFDQLKLNHPAVMAVSEDNNSLGSGPC